MVLVDMNRAQTVEDAHSWSRVGWNPFCRELVGWAQVTIVAAYPSLSEPKKQDRKGEFWSNPEKSDNPS